MSGSAVARSNSAAVTSSPATPVASPLSTPLGQIIEPFREQLTPFLRDGQTLERVAAELVLASRKTPNLDKCPPIALVDAVCRALETGGTIGQDVFIVPFLSKGVYEPTVMVSYQFKAALVQMAGGARSIDARPVYDDEHFVVRYGDRPGIDHAPAMKGRPGRQMIGAYAIAFHGFNHQPTVLFMRLDEIEAVRAKSKQWGPNSNPPVKDCPPWYACKSAVHRLVKLLPKNPKLSKVLGLIDREEVQEFGSDSPDEIARVDAETEDESKAAPAMTLAEATGIVVQDKALGAFSNAAILKIQEQAREHVEREGDGSRYVRLLTATTVVLKAREEGKVFDPTAKKGVAA